MQALPEVEVELEQQDTDSQSISSKQPIAKQNKAKYQDVKSKDEDGGQ